MSKIPHARQNTILKSPVYWWHQRINTACLVPGKATFKYTIYRIEAYFWNILRECIQWHGLMIACSIFTETNGGSGNPVV